MGLPKILVRITIIDPSQLLYAPYLREAGRAIAALRCLGPHGHGHGTGRHAERSARHTFAAPSGLALLDCATQGFVLCLDTRGQRNRCSGQRKRYTRPANQATGCQRTRGKCARVTIAIPAFEHVPQKTANSGTGTEVAAFRRWLWCGRWAGLGPGRAPCARRTWHLRP